VIGHEQWLIVSSIQVLRALPVSNAEPPKPDLVPEGSMRAQLISTVVTPLGFFVLVVLVVEATLAIVAGLSGGLDRTIAIIGMIVLLSALVVIVAMLAVWRPTALGKLPDEAMTRNLASQKGQAIQRIHDLITQFRDVLTIVQRDTFAAFTEKVAFDAVKSVARKRIEEIVKSFKEDARTAGVAKQVNEFSSAVTNAIQNLPFAEELVVERAAITRSGIDIGLAALESVLHGGNPVGKAEDAVLIEVKKRVTTLVNRYASWWDTYSPVIHDTTAKLQNALFKAAMDVVITTQPPK
jgi:hypothetical protein